MQTLERVPRPLTKLWVRVPVVTGNSLQLTGLVLGAGLLFLAAHLQASVALWIVLMLLGWLVNYVCGHAITPLDAATTRPYKRGT